MTFERDRTQWLNPTHMEIGICLEFDREADSETFFFLDKFAPKPATGQSVTLKVVQKFETGRVSLVASIDDGELDFKTSSEVLKKLRTSANVVVHNSTNSSMKRYYYGESLIELDEFQIDEKDKRDLKEAEKKLHSRISQAAKKQTGFLSQLLKKLDEEYDVNLTTLEVGRRSAFPLSVTLQDKQVQVPLHEWGSGTRNRTEVLMSLMQAARTKAAASEENRTTPIVILEEPESFLHPHAQAEFGKILSSLADELGIQVIATTHSPYMLNQRNPAANVLLRRKHEKKRVLETAVVDTSGERWMAPFAEILGIIPHEFEAWREVIGLQNEKVILVEGPVDQAYFEFFRDNHPTVYQIPKDVSIEPYNGVDALRNVAMLRFVKRKFKKMYVTFDLDGRDAVTRHLESIGLKEKQDYLAIGKSTPGADCIEGLLPSQIVSSVYATEVDLVRATQSTKPDERKSARNNLKARLLDQLRQSGLPSSEFADFKAAFGQIARGLKQ